jgi:hypothetical protein
MTDSKIKKIEKIKYKDFYLIIKTGHFTTKKFSVNLAISFITIKINELIDVINELKSK